MAPLTFTDTHNMVAFLSKSEASDGFDQIVDFFNAHTIKYALMVNPTIYVSCIKQFWATAIVEKVNGDVQLQALIDNKKVVVTKAIIRRDLYLDDADRVECLSNDEIFKELFHGICLSTSRKFNFSKYIFDSMVRNVDSPSKFLMYPHFIQVLLDHQVDDMTTHNTRYKSPALTQKVFANLRGVGKGSLGVETPLFDSMLVQSQQQDEAGVEVPITHAQPSTTSAPSPTKLQDTTPTPYDTPPQYQPPIPHDSPLQDQPTTHHDSPMPLLTTLMETCATLSQKGRKIAAIDADKGTTLVDAETGEEEGVSAVITPELVSTAEPIVFDDEDVTMTMAQTLIKLKAEKARILDEKIA
nr:xylulose kinase-1 [Tanacetum cinerariifolium]